MRTLVLMLKFWLKKCALYVGIYIICGYLQYFFWEHALQKLGLSSLRRE